MQVGLIMMLVFLKNGQFIGHGHGVGETLNIFVFAGRKMKDDN